MIVERKATCRLHGKTPTECNNNTSCATAWLASMSVAIGQLSMKPIFSPFYLMTKCRHSSRRSIFHIDYKNYTYGTLKTKKFLKDTFVNERPGKKEILRSTHARKDNPGIDNPT
jgi:hypothetical protein